LNEQAKAIDDQIKNEPGGLRLRPQIDRYSTIEQALQAVADGTDVAAVIQSTEWERLGQQYPMLREGHTITGEVSTAGGFLLGTNDIGQDVLSRLLWGTRIALIVGFSSSIVALVLGVPLGLFAGFLGGPLDRLLSLVMDSLYAFPGLILAIAITAVLGPSVLNVIVAIAVLYIPTYYRIVRGQTLSVKEEVYVEAARSIGARSREILQRYIFPNVIPSVAIIFSVNVADAILTGAGLSFLGLGLPPTIADWGIDVARGQRFIQTGWWMVTYPGLAIIAVVLAFTLMGEGLTEIFNPKLRER
jgi:peptide/nickel transport system permease protein